MRICRYRSRTARTAPPELGLLLDDSVLSLKEELPADADLVDCLPPDGVHFERLRDLAASVDAAATSQVTLERVSLDAIDLLAPVPRPSKLLLLAGNYAKHIEEGGEMAVERAETFPYVFQKPPTTTINDPGGSFKIPSVSPTHLDWELELGVVIGREARGVSEADALGYVAGYTVINDISDRGFRPNPERRERSRDRFFDWQHGKWHDGSCPMGPCVLSADAVEDPQAFDLELRLNGEVRQCSSTACQIFSVAQVVAFLSSFVTLEPGDVISTGTPDGVGNTSGTYLRPGDRLDARIEGIGTLVTHVVA